MPWPLYAQGTNLFYPLNSQLGGSLGWSGHFWRREGSHTPAGYQTPHHLACSLVTILTKLSQLPSTDGRTPKWIFTKHGLQLVTTRNKRKAGQEKVAASGLCKSTAHDKLSGLGLSLLEHLLHYFTSHHKIHNTGMVFKNYLLKNVTNFHSQAAKHSLPFRTEV